MNESADEKFLLNHFEAIGWSKIPKRGLDRFISPHTQSTRDAPSPVRPTTTPDRVFTNSSQRSKFRSAKRTSLVTMLIRRVEYGSFFPQSRQQT